jgi:hypothetical protein
MAKHMELDIGEATFVFRRKTDAIAAEEALEAFYLVRTNLPRRVLGDAATVGAYRSLAQGEQAFRSLHPSAANLQLDRAKGMLPSPACVLLLLCRHHMRARLAPMLCDETDHEAAAAKRASIIAKAECKRRLDDATKLPPWVIHDLRRSVATGMNEIGIPPWVVEAVLNHASGHRAGVAGVYNRAVYEAEKTTALARWDEHLMVVIDGRESNVATLRR